MELLPVLSSLVAWLQIFQTDVLCNKYEDQLYEDLLYFHISQVRPVRNESDRVTVKFGASLIRLIDLDEKEQILTTNLWLVMQWEDPGLVWNPDQYGGTYKLHLPSTQIWTPDIVLYNNAAGDPHVTILNDAMVFYDGTIVWKPPAIYKSFCEIDIKWFPFDEQSCEMKFGGWTHHAKFMDMKQIPENEVTQFIRIQENGKRQKVWYLEKGMDLSYYYLNAGWDLMNLTSERKEQVYADCCGINFYVDITFKFRFRRKPLFYTVNLVIPCMLLAILSTFVFYLPANSGVKITFSISIFVTLAVLFMVLIDLIPPTSLVVPLMGKYLIFTCILVTISVTLAVVTMNIHLRTGLTHHMPRWMKIVFLKKLPRFLCIKPSDENFDEESPDEDEETSSKSSDPKWSDMPPESVAGRKLAQYRRPSPYFIDPDTPLSHLPLEPLAPKDPKTMVNHPLIIHKMLRNVQIVTQHFRTIAEEEKESEEWSYVAMVIDRLFLIFFTLANMVGSMVIVLQAPSLTDRTAPLHTQRPTSPLGGDTMNLSSIFARDEL